MRCTSSKTSLASASRSHRRPFETSIGGGEPMAIIVVSTQMGAGGPEIGMALGQKCGYRYVDQELLQDAGRRYGLAEERLSHLDESKPTIFERFDAETRHHITVLQTTLLELAELDNAVFMRGGGQWLLRGVPLRTSCAVTTPRRPAGCAISTRSTSTIPCCTSSS